LAVTDAVAVIDVAIMGATVTVIMIVIMIASGANVKEEKLSGKALEKDAESVDGEKVREFDFDDNF
jgi:hypothetical protein